HVGARLMAGLMSVVVFLTPAHADPAANAHASAIPLSVLVVIIVTPAMRVDAPRRGAGQPPFLSKHRAVDAHKAELNSEIFLPDSLRWPGTRDRKSTRLNSSHLG